MNCEQVKIDLAAEMLTGRAEPEKAARTAHLDGCPPCGREREELRGLRDLLATTVPLEPDGGPPRPDPERALRAVRRHAAHPLATPEDGPAPAGKPVRRAPVPLPSLAMAVAFAAGALSAGGLRAGPGGRRDRHAAPVYADGGHCADGHVKDPSAPVGVRAVPWGSEISLSPFSLGPSLLGASRRPLRCRLVAVAVSGASETVAHWSVPDGVPGAADGAVRGSSSLAPQDIARLMVESQDGTQLLAFDLGR
ncbi:hypothetical protein [Streptomyces sp. YS415]|uniref:hypothetical protein n=1 Tax=Streptomyces sp. YS415 TaxID=2944806 RepID=UPI00202042A4|nr:hypothetical protein [Streptomyces sp. YS415]MCL7430313.1 hypothetical protein [Streptomyces sp. YS415]